MIYEKTKFEIAIILQQMNSFNNLNMKFQKCIANVKTGVIYQYFSFNHIDGCD